MGDDISQTQSHSRDARPCDTGTGHWLEEAVLHQQTTDSSECNKHASFQHNSLAPCRLVICMHECHVV